jgi:hypothetical protein
MCYARGGSRFLSFDQNCKMRDPFPEDRVARVRDVLTSAIAYDGEGPNGVTRS